MLLMGAPSPGNVSGCSTFRCDRFSSQFFQFEPEAVLNSVYSFQLRAWNVDGAEVLVLKVNFRKELLFFFF